MSVSNTLTLLAARLATVNPTPQPAPNQIYINPQEKLVLGNFPEMILRYAIGTDFTFSQETYGATGIVAHRYIVELLVALGPRQMKIGELHDRALPWPQAITVALVADQTLGGQIAFIGDGGPTGLKWKGRVQPITVGDGTYWGIKGLIPITEKPTMTIA